MTEPVNHLEGRSGNLADVLGDLTDRQLEELTVYLTQERDALTAQPSDGRAYGNRYSAYRIRTMIPFVNRERDHRRKIRDSHPSPS